MASGKFHHGNLRAALIELATAELAAGRAEELSLRELATRLGVSRAAPYRHFSTKDELLQAVAAEGLQKVSVVYEHAENMDAPPKERLRVACRAYLDLAKQNPGLFNLLFFTEAYVRMPARAHAPGSAFGGFERLVAGACGAKQPERARPLALAIWSLIHGFAILRMQGRIQRFADVEQTEEQILAMVCDRLSAVEPT